MDLSLIPTPASDFNQSRTGTRFTVRSANSPTYNLTRRSGVRRPRDISVLTREESEEGREQDRYKTKIAANGTKEDKDGTVVGYHARTESRSGVKGHSEEDTTSGHKMSTRLNQSSSTGKTVTVAEVDTDRSGNRASERSGRTDLRRYNVSSRSKSLDWRAGERSPGRGIRDAKRVSIQAGDLEERQTEVKGMRGRVTSSVEYYNSARTRDDVRERNTLSSANWGLSLPSRFRSQTATDSDYGPKGGQSILERIEKLYGSAGFGKTEDSGRVRDFSAGGTLPRRFSSEERGSGSPVSSGKSFTWTQKDASESLISPETGKDRTSRRQWQGQTLGRYSDEGGFKWNRGFEDIGTRSLDRARSKYTVAAQLRSARAAQSNTLLEEERSDSLSDLSRLRERRLSGSGDKGGVNYQEKKGEPNGLRERSSCPVEPKKVKTTELKIGGTNEDVFESNPQKITLKTVERKKFPDVLQVTSAASVKNKIHQFEVLTQRSQSVAAGQILMQRRAFSVPAQLSDTNHGVKKSGSAKAVGGLKYKWEGLKEGEEQGEKVEVKAAAEREPGSERPSSVGEIGLRSGRNEREDFDKYSRLKSSMDIPLNEGAQRRRRNFYIDETDFSNVLSPEEVSKWPSSSSNPGDSPTGAQRPSSVTSPLSDEDKTPTNTPKLSPLLSLTKQSESESTPVLKKVPKASHQESTPVLPPLATSFHSKLPDLISPDVKPSRQKPVLDLDAWVAGLSSQIKTWDENEDDEDDDESTQKDDDSNYDSDSAESSVTITSNMSQSDRRSFCVSLSDLCNFAGVDYESENDSDEWQCAGRRTASLSSDMSALSCVSVLPSEELDKLLEEVKGLGDSNLQDYDDVQVVVLHKEMGVGLGFSVAGGVDQNKPITVHKVFHTGVAAQEGSIREGDQVLSINGTSLSGYVHWEALRVLRRAKGRDLGVVVVRRGEISNVSKEGAQTNNLGPAQTQPTEAGEQVSVQLEKNNRDLGFSLQGGVGSSLESRPLTVQKIFQGGPVDKLRPGDEVLEIGGVSMVGMRRLEVWTLIRRLPPGPVDVILRRPAKHPES